jgi:hypothetical protein
MLKNASVIAGSIGKSARPFLFFELEMLLDRYCYYVTIFGHSCCPQEQEVL